MCWCVCGVCITSLNPTHIQRWVCTLFFLSSSLLRSNDSLCMHTSSKLWNNTRTRFTFQKRPACLSHTGALAVPRSCQVCQCVESDYSRRAWEVGGWRLAGGCLILWKPKMEKHWKCLNWAPWEGMISVWTCLDMFGQLGHLWFHGVSCLSQLYGIISSIFFKYVLSWLWSVSSITHKLPGQFWSCVAWTNFVQFWSGGGSTCVFSLSLTLRDKAFGLGGGL